MLNLTKKQVFFILLLSIVPLIVISVIISLTMESVKNDLSELTERYSGEAREREIENARVRYLSGEGGELLSTYAAISSKLDNISSAYTTLFGETTGTFPGEWRGPYLYHFTNSSFNLTLPDAVLSGTGEVKCNGAVQLRGVFTFSGNFTGHMEGLGHIVVVGESSGTYSGEVSASINGPVVGTLGRSLWNSSSGCRDALVDGSGEVCLSGEFYGHISGSVSLINYSGYVLIPTPHSNLPGVNKTDIIENVERLGKILSTTGFLPESKLELLLPVEGGMLPLNYSRPFIMTLFTSLPSWSLSDNQTFLSPPPGLYPSGTWYVISDPGEDNMRFAVKINTAGLSKYISQNIPGDYQVLTSPPPVHYENEGYSFKPSNYTLSKGCRVAKAERGNEVLWVIYRNESLYGIYIVRVVSDDEMSSLLPDAGSGISKDIEEVTANEMKALERARFYSLVGVVLTALAIALFSIYLGYLTTRPIVGLINGVKGLAERVEDIDENEVMKGRATIPPVEKDETLQTGDELEDLLEGINSLVGALNRSYVSLKEALDKRDDALKKLKSSYNALLQTARGLERNEEAMNMLLSNVSHEIRTPLNVIMGRLELLDKRRSEEELNKFLPVVRRNLMRLQLLLEDLLTVSMIETGRIVLNKRRFDLSQAVREVVELEKETAEERRIKIIEKYPGSVPIFGDKERLQAAIRNVVENAIKFSSEGSKVWVEVSEGKRWTRITVADRGAGIPPAEQRRVFRRFYQIDPSSRRERGGVGIGLYLVKNIVEMHGGKVVLESELGRGTRVDILLPRDENEKDTHR